MVANAGIAPPADFLDTTAKAAEDMWQINVRGVLFSYQAAAKQMIKQKTGGRLIGRSERGATSSRQLPLLLLEHKLSHSLGCILLRE